MAQAYQRSQWGLVLVPSMCSFSDDGICYLPAAYQHTVSLQDLHQWYREHYAVFGTKIIFLGGIWLLHQMSGDLSRHYQERGCYCRFLHKEEWLSRVPGNFSQIMEHLKWGRHERWMCSLGIHHHTSAPYHPKKNGLTKQIIRALKRIMERVADGAGTK